MGCALSMLDDGKGRGETAEGIATRCASALPLRSSFAVVSWLVFREAVAEDVMASTSEKGEEGGEAARGVFRVIGCDASCTTCVVL